MCAYKCLKGSRSDFVYMVPPFIAYYGTLAGGAQGSVYLQTAYDQCRLYRDGLRDESGFWRHIAQGPFQDTTHWATGAQIKLVWVKCSLTRFTDIQGTHGQLQE